MKLIFISIIISVFIIIGAFKASALTITVTANVEGCGNNIINSGEQCDGSSLGGSTCVSRGFISGSLSCNSVCTFNTSSCVSSSGGGGGGGGGGNPTPAIPDTNVVFTGRAYPKSVVTLLKDAQVVATTISGTDANFQVTIAGLSGGTYIFSLYSEDNKGIRSSLLTFPVSVTSGATTKVSGVFIAPTIDVDKSEVKRGENISIFGQSTPVSNIVISINSEEEFFVKKKSDKDGIYLINFDTSVLEIGQHHTKSKADIDGEITAFGKTVGFVVGTKDKLKELVDRVVPKKGDANNDSKVNLVDFSITAFWYKRPNPPISIDLNNDGKVNLVDFSILAFNWTG